MATRDRGAVGTQQGKNTKCLKTKDIIDKFTPLRPGLKDHPIEKSHRDFSSGMALYNEYSTSTDCSFWYLAGNLQCRM
jgi:hypothetical protein